MIVVTGGSGFIGTHLCRHLSDAGYQVRVIDIVPPKPGFKGEFVRASILDPTLPKLFSDAYNVIHLAALVDVATSIKDPVSDFRVNVTGTLNVLESARKAGVHKVAYASSAAVYGEPIKIPIDEKHPTHPLSPYGLSKLTAERYVLLYNSLYGMKNTALRLFNVYGSGQNPAYAGVMTRFRTALDKGEIPTVFGDGTQTRDFVHVDDVCAAFVLALKHDGGPFNIASGVGTSLNDLLKNMTSISPVYLPARVGDIAHSVADISLAKDKLKYSPGTLLHA